MNKIIRHTILAITLLTGVTNVHAQDIIADADSAYNSLAYARALELYMEAADSLGTSSDLYYNIGNTYYRLGDLGRAILWYERALQLDPTNKDAQDNLAFVNTRITDKPIDDRSLLSKSYDKITTSAHSDTWAWLSLTFFILTVIAFVGYLVTTVIIVRKTCFFGGGVMLLITICTLCITFTSSHRSSDHESAIIIVPSAQLSTAPREAGDADTQAFLLHEGTKVQIIDSVKPADKSSEGWYEVKIGSNARAWINGKNIERI